HQNKIIGFCMRKMDGNDSRFGPIGIAKEYQGKGLGGILLELFMQEARKSQIYYLYFLWTGGTNINFYGKHGFSIVREYHLYRKEL
ncbi:MAG: GNAT family N-acetyltransferase, partial [Erysipelotrichaceae bacterium]